MAWALACKEGGFAYGWREEEERGGGGGGFIDK